MGDLFSYTLFLKGMAAAIIVVSSRTEKTVHLKFVYDLTNLLSPGDELTVKPNKKSYLIFRPYKLGEKIGLGLTLSYQLLD